MTDGNDANKDQFDQFLDRVFGEDKQETVMSADKVILSDSPWPVKKESEPKSAYDVLGEAQVKRKLEDAARLFDERGKLYGNCRTGISRQGHALYALFGGKVTLATPEDFSRFINMVMMTTKFARYIQNFNNGGHEDSIKDLGVYAFMQQDLDEAYANLSGEI